MGYSPKHAKPVSLRSATHHRPSGGATRTGRHRADMGTAAYHAPAREPVPAEVPEPLSELIPAQRSPVTGS